MKWLSVDDTEVEDLVRSLKTVILRYEVVEAEMGLTGIYAEELPRFRALLERLEALR